MNILIFTRKGKLFEYKRDSTKDAITEYIRQNVGFGRGFLIDLDTWEDVSSSFEATETATLVSLVNELCSRYSYEIDKIVTGYSKLYPCIPPTQDNEEPEDSNETVDVPDDLVPLVNRELVPIYNKEGKQIYTKKGSV